jgi:hypothetical protein
VPLSSYRDHSLFTCLLFFPPVWLRATSHQLQDTNTIHSFSSIGVSTRCSPFWFFTRSTTAVRLVFYTSSPRCSLPKMELRETPKKK